MSCEKCFCPAHWSIMEMSVKNDKVFLQYRHICLYCSNSFVVVCTDIEGADIKERRLNQYDLDHEYYSSTTATQYADDMIKSKNRLFFKD